MADEPLFRTAISGFNKDDVIAYVDGINRAAAENQDWFDRQSKAMAETIRRLTKENNRLKADGVGGEGLEAARAELEQKKHECEELRQKLAEAEQSRQTDSLANNEQLRAKIEAIVMDREAMKKQILRYQEEIRSLNEHLPENEKNSREQIAAARLEAEKSKAQVRDLASQLSALQDQMDQLKEHAQRQIDELTLQNRQLADRLEGGDTAASDTKMHEAQRQISYLEQELARVRAENDSLKAGVAASSEEMRTMYDKSRLYDDIKNNVGNIILEARRRADLAIQEAELASKQILEQSTLGLSQMQERIQVMKADVDQAQRKYSESAAETGKMFNNLSDTINITENQIISLIGPPMPKNEQETERPAAKPKRKNGNDDIWPL